MKKDRVFPLGALCEADGIHVAACLKPEKECGIVLVSRGKTWSDGIRIPFRQHLGNVYYGKLTGVKKEKYSYCFYEDDNYVSDPFMRKAAVKRAYGKQAAHVTLGAFYEDTFDWSDDENPKIPWSEAVNYLLHARGFTKHSSSQVIHRGTFAGIAEKIPYLKELGVTTLEVMPVYEFEELEKPKEEETAYTSAPVEKPERINYWGFKEGFYFVPKTGYSAGKDSCLEMKELVKKLHQNGMELVLQFFFPRNYRTDQVKEVLAWWLQEYHVDGFHVMGESIHMEQIATDPLFTDTKLLYEHFDTEHIYGQKETPRYKNLALCDGAGLSCLRQFLKGDDNKLRDIQRMFYASSPYFGIIHFMSNYYTMTMYDMVSYDRKHNEANGEDNRDGTDANFSWNCGEEGPTRRKNIQALRRRQLKNAMLLLFLMQGTPMLVAGDEFARTAGGNNNPYCQDNDTNWLNWKYQDRNRELWEFVRSLIAFRKAHPVFRMEKGMRLIDYLGCGVPDLSFHSEEAWRNPQLPYDHHFAVMLCGAYAANEKCGPDDYFYVAVNMHWEKHVFALPHLPKGMEWVLALNSGEDGEIFVDDGRKAILDARCIRVYQGRRKNASLETF